MQPLLRSLTSRWLLTAFGAVSCGVMIWLYGPFLSFLSGWIPRLGAVFVLMMIWAGANLLIERSRRHTDALLAGGVAGPAAAASSTAAASAEEAAVLRGKLTEAMTLLRQAHGRRGYLYQQPWYMIIGPPGAGKTTALANAGLEFPLAGALGQGEVRGLGGTRDCDWSFTDEAVLIDTAGRYTTQDSHTEVDKAGWEAFLNLLRRTRPRQPLNGVIVAIAINEIAGATDDGRRAHGRLIRTRIRELYQRLGVRLPVYVVFTKADLLVGFSEFFDKLDTERRAQVWGMTFPLESSETGPLSAFAFEFRALVKHLSDRLIDRLQEETNSERRGLLAGFPMQFASIEGPVSEFLVQAFGSTRLDPAPLLRGVYFGSGTQEGTPIDRLTGALARSFGIDPQRAELLRPRRGRGFFLERLIKSVIFGEAMLVARNSAAARRHRIVRAVAWTLSVSFAVGGIAALWLMSSRAGTSLSHFDAALADYRAAVAKQPLNPVPLAARDLPVVLPLLDRARALPFGAADSAAQSELGLGLSQRRQLAAAANLAYGNALNRILLPRLVSLVEAHMWAHLGDTDDLYQATRIYLFLGQRIAMDHAAVREWFIRDWNKTYDGANLAPFRADLLRHLNALLAAPFSETVPLDSNLLGKFPGLDQPDQRSGAGVCADPDVGRRPERGAIRAGRRDRRAGQHAFRARFRS